MMRNKRVWILSGIGTLLFILAALQYRWIAEASQAEQERLKQTLVLATNRLAQDFESEFLHLGFAARVVQPPRVVRFEGVEPPRVMHFEGDLEEAPSARLARQYSEWKASSDPELLQDLFVTKILSENNVGLF